jgi:CRISPR-associated endonuclease Csn1
MPDKGEIMNRSKVNLDSSKIYKMVSCTGRVCYFLHHSLSKVILDKVEMGSLNKEEKAIDGRMIKQYCQKISLSRLSTLNTKK